MYDTILVPTDGSEHAERAARHASRFARVFDGDLHLLGVADVVSEAGPFDAGGVDPEHLDVFESDAERRVEETEAAIEGSVTPTVAVRTGTPGEEIVEYAAEVGADLLAMGTHGRTGIQRYVLGSVTERVLRLAEVPVFTVRADDRGGPDEAIEEVLVPTDGSICAAAAVDHGINLAGVADARVHALSVVDEPSSPEMGVGPGGLEPARDDIRKTLEERASDAVASVATAAETADLAVTTAVQYGHTSQELLAYVDDAEVDLVVMGTQGRTGLSRYLLGSTTERVVRHAPVPVMAVPVPDEE